MASRVWVLIEWVFDHDIVIPSYDVVNVDSLESDATDLNPGNITYVRTLDHINPKRAKILRISENKGYLKEQKEVLDRESQHVKIAVHCCIQTFKRMHSNILEMPQTSGYNPRSHVQRHSSNYSFDSDSETDMRMGRNRTPNFNMSASMYHSQYKGKEPVGNHAHSSMNSKHRKRPTMVCTPQPSRNIKKKVVSCDQGTQTENSHLEERQAKIDALEAIVHSLYQKFEALISQLNAKRNAESEHDADSCSSGSDEGQEVLITPETSEDTGGDESNQQLNSSMNNAEENDTPKSPRVRRVSAQTTNNIENVSPNDMDLVPIGAGVAMVPARVLNDIDWTSHTSATRQLLQAVFPRRVLATHSLTGKQSPAFMNRPPKKILDPKLVDDIVRTVGVRCGVPFSLVRQCITVKCTDEAKLYRNRQLYKHRRRVQRHNEVNVPPSTPSSEDSDIVE